MQQYFDPRILALLSLMAIYASVLILFRLPPTRTTSGTCTLLQVIAILIGGSGLLYLSYLMPAFILLMATITYISAEWIFSKRITGHLERATIQHSLTAGVFLFFITWVMSLIFESLFPYTTPLLVVILATCFYFLLFGHINPLRREVDEQKKRNVIAGIQPYAAPLSQFLTRYHPDWYPPPISDHLKTAIATYATFFRDLDKANGKQPSDIPDDELIRSLRCTPLSRQFQTEIKIGCYTFEPKYTIAGV